MKWRPIVTYLFAVIIAMGKRFCDVISDLESLVLTSWPIRSKLPYQTHYGFPSNLLSLLCFRFFSFVSLSADRR